MSKNTIQLNELVQIDLEKIKTTNINEGVGDTALNSLGIKIYDQAEIEKGIYSQVDYAVHKHNLDAKKMSLIKELKELEETYKQISDEQTNKEQKIETFVSSLKYKRIKNLRGKDSIKALKNKIERIKIKLDEINESLSNKALTDLAPANDTLDFIKKECVVKEEIEDYSLPLHEALLDKPSYLNKLIPDSSTIKDDGDLLSYNKRLKKIKNGRATWILHNSLSAMQKDTSSLYINLTTEYRIPNFVWEKLFSHQKDAVKWLIGLHKQDVGGILGDEMGLGKTIQIIAFFISLATSRTLREISTRNDDSNLPTDIGGEFEKYNRLPGPCLIVCPATLMNQWVQEFRHWWPYFRVAILHQTGSFDKTKKTRLLKEIARSGSILITTYTGLALNEVLLAKIPWHYVVLDEGHKIRNHESKISRAAKRVSLAGHKNTHCIILSGTPIQNNLKELWTLIDFVYPGKLGTLTAFMENFAVPIVAGGYANASQVQVTTAYRCACILRESISPYLLRRTKNDSTFRKEVQIPEKNEQVLFCQLTAYQRYVYLDYLASSDVDHILRGSLKVFKGLITLRKICNHPDLVRPFDVASIKLEDTTKCEPDINALIEQTGYWKRSGKMIVLKELLKIWAKQGNRVLVFAQTRQILNIIETFVQQKNYRYLRLDGTSPIKTRQSVVDTFNADPSYFAFLLTTRVGGLGLNLTGANKVVIFDPDWNPCVDGQAKERAWRIGQSRDVTVYRLLIAGTVEEKIYQRQIFKQYITNRVLMNPKLNNRIIFKMNDLKELFTLSSPATSTLSQSSSLCQLSPPRRPVKVKERGSSGHVNSDKTTLLSPDRNGRKRKRRYATFEGNVVSHLAYQEPYKNEPSQNEKDAELRDRMIKDGGEGYVMEKILRNAHVTGSLSHDSVMKMHPREGTIDRIAEVEAQRIASAAVLNVRASRKDYFNSMREEYLPCPRDFNVTSSPPPEPSTSHHVQPSKQSKVVSSEVSQEELFLTQLDSEPLKYVGPVTRPKVQRLFSETTIAAHMKNEHVIDVSFGDRSSKVENESEKQSSMDGEGVFYGNKSTTSHDKTLSSSFILSKIAQRNQPLP